MLEFALIKLGKREGVDNNLFLLSLWFMRVTLHIESSISFEMVAKTMATCTWISEDRATCLVSHNSEPVLAEAAAMHLYSNPTPALTVLRDALVKADVSLGDLGELIAQILLLQAFDSCVKVSRPKIFRECIRIPSHS
jgi:hypothetical protein